MARKRVTTLVRGAVAFAMVTGLAAVVVTGCGGPTQRSDGSPAQAGNDKGTEAYSPNIDPANFVNKVDNKYFPLEPGTTYIYEGKSAEGTERVEVTITHDTKRIIGVDCVVRRDKVFVNGELVEDTFDWHAQDKEGTVWYFGEDTKEYENGKVVSSEGSWEAGVDGAKPAIIMKADPKVGDSYRQEYYPGHAMDMAKVLSLNESATVSIGSFDQLLMTEDWNPLDPGAGVSHKYYAQGIGNILEVYVKGPSERVELIDIKKE